MRAFRRAIAALLLAVTLLAPTIALAASITSAEYAQRVAEASAAVEAAMPRVGNADVAAGVASAVRTLVLEVQSVSFAGKDMPVEQGTLTSVVARLEAAQSASVRTDVAGELLGQLRSQEVALGTPGAAPKGDAAALKRVIDEVGVTESRDAPKRLQEALLKLVEKVLKWFGKVLGTPAASGSARVIFYSLLVASALAVAWIIFVIVRRVRSAVAGPATAGTSGAGGAVIAAAEGLPDDALAFADAEAAAGRYRDAVRALFGGAARELVDRGVVPRTRTRTDGEMLADVALARPALLGGLSALCAAFEPAWYGHVDPGASGYAAARAVYTDLMTALEGEAE